MQMLNINGMTREPKPALSNSFYYIIFFTAAALVEQYAYQTEPVKIQEERGAL